MKKYPTEKEVYNQILKEIRKRGFGLLLAYTGLGAFNRNEPSWTEVILVGENYKTFFLLINPKSIPHFEDPATYINYGTGRDRQRLIKKIKAEHQKAIKSGRFIYVDKERVSLKDVKKAIQQCLSKLYPELLGAKLYLLDINKLDSVAEYWSEVEEAIKEKYGQSLEKFLETKKPIITKGKPINYAFIDSQNLNLGTSKNIYRGKEIIYTGWKLDFKKFRRYLTDKFRVKRAFLFIGYIKKNEKLYKSLKSFGYKIVFKPTVNDREGKPKGNVDAELVLHAAAIEYANYGKAVIVSGDGDFYCLHNFLLKHNKLKKIIIPNRHSESSLLRKFQKYKVFLYREKETLKFDQ